MKGLRCRHALALLPLLVLAGAANCPFDLAPCPDLDELCPDVQCDDYVQNRDGCSICECVEDQEPVLCFSDGECAAGQRCDTANYCEAAPGCAAGTECDAVCYGRCVDAPTSCSTDADCPDGQLCAFFDNARPAEEAPSGDADSGGGAAPVAPSGVCISASCGQADVALPTCPPGTEPSFEVGVDGCPYPVCVVVDYCRDLFPDQCLATPGCTLVEEPCACDPATGACDDCVSQARCVADNDCYSLGVDACLQNPNCELVASGGTGGEGVRCEVCDAAGNCQPCDATDPAPPPPTNEVVCVPRVSDGTCLSDVDCGAGEVCQPSVVCGSGCEPSPDGGGDVCYEECWNERGWCVPSATSCYQLPPELCANDPRCELTESAGMPCDCLPEDPNCGCEAPMVPVCVPRAGLCQVDGDCLQGQHCAWVESCPPCDPSSGFGCAAPCYAEGRCVDGPPPPLACSIDADCPSGQACIEVSVCEVCPGQPEPPPGTDPAPPAPCDAACYVENVCAWAGGSCYSDQECGFGSFCDFTQCDGASNLVACPGTCVPVGPSGLCQTDDQCAPGERCAIELDVCLQNPDDATGGCWSQCVPADPAPGALCLADGDCGVTGTCRFHPDVCLDDPSSAALVCSGWCVEECLTVETRALDPATQRCVTFADSCVPPGFIAGGC
ncbi:MAG: hypothetical protein HYS27_18410 [Deltaproteobacteria bacterium]|nr:hypothetical protein [Deltaproteobacteria bacterium]